MAPEEHFDAIAAARELEEAMGDAGEARPSGSSDRYVAMLEAEVEALNVQLAGKDEKLRAAEARAERANTEIARAEERIAREAEREIRRRARELMLDMIAVLDDLERAIEHSRGELDGSAFFEGMELVQRSFLARLARHGVTAMQVAAGQKFDPARHEAVGVIPALDPAQDGRIAGVTRTGYLCGDEVLRPAAAVVFKRR